jgi:hypothetical protein
MQNELPMKIVGGKRPHSVWERFARLQRSAQQFYTGGRCPRGVFRFKTWEEFEEWQTNYRTQPAFPTTQT